MTGLNTDTRIIKASFRECLIQDRALFDISSCLFLVSIGSFNHEGKRLKATINLINRSFKSCTILIGDTLYRHNFRNFKVITEEDAYLKGLELGNAWIERNLTCIESLTIPYKVTRWDKWLKHTEFKNSLLNIEDWYNKDIRFRKNFDSTATEYLQRNATQANNNVTFESCLLYLKEECAAMTLWVHIDNVDISIYLKDLNGVYGVCNRYMLDMLNIKDRDFVIGKTDYELPWHDVAKILEKHDKLAIKEGYYSTEESYVNNKNEKKIYLTKKTRLLDSDGHVIGVMGTSTDITAEKEAERLQAEVQKHEAIESKNKLIRGFSQQLLRVINCFQVLNDRGEEDFDFYDTEITLTKRETEVLYLLSRGKKPKDIAIKLGISPKTAQNVIDGQLFPKLNVYNIGELLEKAYMLNLIPFTL